MTLVRLECWFLASNSEGQEQIRENKWPLEAAKNTETPINAFPVLYYSFDTSLITPVKI